MKRQFEGFNIPAQRLATDPSREYEDPKPIQAKNPDAFDEYDQITGDGDVDTTKFADWSEAELHTFLDQRGEDYDDCTDKSSLIRRAAECEVNTGPAVRPSAAHLHTEGTKEGDGDAGEVEIDPLDAFMAEMNEMENAAAAAAAAGDQAAEAKTAGAGLPDKKKARKNGPERIEVEDHVADYVEAVGRRKGISTTNTHAAAARAIEAVAAARAQGYDSDQEVYAVAKALEKPGQDEEEAAIAARLNGDIESLEALEHSKVQYEEFYKEFYEAPAELAGLDPSSVAQRRRALEIRVAGYNVPVPVETFEQCGFDAGVMQAIAKAGYSAPTPIQAQALPTVLSGRDVLGIAKTGSGKTAAFVLPMIVHIMDQRELSKGEGPIAIIVAPTRELAEQIHREARKLSRPHQLRVCAAFGGLSKQQQFKELRNGAELAVCTPGRMIDLIKMKACTTTRVTYLVFDEADRMFDLGFEPQVRSLIGQVRPDRQTLLFSATMPRKLENLVAQTMTSPVRITVGIEGGANEDVRQLVEVLENDAAKLKWLVQQIPDFIDNGDVLLFANHKAKVDELAASLGTLGVARVAALHGDMDQATRMEVLSSFKSGATHVLVATDVAARGLDIKSIKTVINYDPAKDMETHVHRIGRTGRAGDKEGTAYTLLVRNDTRAAADLVQCLAAAGQEVSQAVHELASRDKRFQRKGGGRGRGGAGGGRGGGRWAKNQPGGSGLGFAPGGGAASTGYASGFAPSRGTADAHFAAPVPSSAPAPVGGVLPPVPHHSVQYSVQGAHPPPQQQQPQQQQQPPMGPMAERGHARHAAVSQHFKNSFVSTGVRQGDVGSSAEIVLPKGSRQGDNPPQRPLPPPPVPVTQRPMYLQPVQFGGGRGGGGRGAQPVVAPATTAAMQSEEVQRAIAQARAIAERLSAKAPGPF